MFYYRLYGLAVASQLAFPDAEGATLQTGAKPADVTVTLGSVPDCGAHENVGRLNDTWYYSAPGPQCFYMHCNGFDFEITNGNTIKVDTHRQPMNRPELITYILGSAFGVIAIQRELVPLHGAAVATGDTAVIIAGYSGSGKSAVLSALIQAGYRYLADDVSVVSLEGGKPFVLPSYPQRKIAVAAALETGEDTSAAALIREDGREKYTFRNTGEWVDRKLPLSFIVEVFPTMKRDDSPFSPEIREINGHASLGMVIRNQYRMQFSSGIGTPPSRMKKLLEITSSVKTYQLIRPACGSPVRETAQMIVETCF